ncbi:hypothetical protein [Streptomyces cyaneofuscatus]|uniref:Uncharacterized protein n=1 Tax=Streptomyces cyaneofuscatus TaxID=66883 RepID=A0ABZ1F289_9ACTN|nr:hypothetical protein [Streptomyces cyaneofuscatus]WSB10524.1 hypothetical protein OG849_26390 [Streptomyces cyaneofuscatus]WSD45942.1 hypothetical protein OG857_09010 [Streptomyces cyaneofuscatus]
MVGVDGGSFLEGRDLRVVDHDVGVDPVGPEDEAGVVVDAEVAERVGRGCGGRRHAREGGEGGGGHGGEGSAQARTRRERGLAWETFTEFLLSADPCSGVRERMPEQGWADGDGVRHRGETSRSDRAGRKDGIGGRAETRSR